MTDESQVDLHTLPEPVTEDVLGLARLLSAHPQARSALMRSIQRQQDARDKHALPTVNLACPHCGAAEIPYLTLPGKDGPKVFARRPVDCCDHARRDAAENALYYALNPNNDPAERVETADLYAALKESITAPDVRRELDTHELLLADIEARVGGLHRAQGGQ